MYATIDAGTGRNGAYGLLVIQRLLREQHKRGGAHVSPAVLAADLDLAPKTVLKLLGDLERAGVIDRQRDHRLDSDDQRVYSVPLADSYYAINVEAIDPDQSRRLEPVELGGRTLTVLATPLSSGLLAKTLGELEERPPEATAAAVERAVSENLTGETILAEDLLARLRPTLEARSADTYPALGPTPEPDSAVTSTALAEAEAIFRADARDDEDELDEEPQTPPAGAEEKQSLEEETAEAALPRSTEAILYAQADPTLRGLLLRDLVETLAIHRAMNDDEPLTEHQKEIIDDQTSRALFGLHSLPGMPRERFAVQRATIKRACHAEELIAAVKSARPSPEPVIDIFAGAGMRRAEDV